MSFSDADVQARLRALVDPNTGRDFVSSKSVRKIDVRNGDVNAKRTVTITLLSEDQAQVVLTWKLLRAFPVKYSAGELNAKGNDVVMEELVLAYERLEME